MQYALVTAACGMIVVLLLYQEHTDSRIPSHAATSGWFALGLIVRIVVIVVLLVMFSYIFSGV